MMTEEQVLTGNLAIAEMVHGKKVDGMFIMRPVPPAISNSTWLGYTEYAAHFHDSYDWQAIALRFITNLGYEVLIKTFSSNGKLTHVCNISRPNSFSVTSKFSDISCCNAIFFALVEFVARYNSKIP